MEYLIIALILSLLGISLIILHRVAKLEEYLRDNLRGDDRDAEDDGWDWQRKIDYGNSKRQVRS